MDIVLRSNTSATATTALSPEGAALSAITIGFPLLALVLVVLRIYTRVKLAKLRLDDYLIIVAVAFALAQIGFAEASIYAGFGRAFNTLSRVNLVSAIKWLYFGAVCQLSGIYFARLSIVGLLLRLSTHRNYSSLLYGIVVILTIFQFFNYLYLFAQCAPLVRIWDRSVAGTCWSKNSQLAFIYPQIVIEIVTTMAFIILPIAFLWGISFNPRKRAAIGFILFLAIFIFGITIFKAYAVQSTDSNATVVALIEFNTIQLNFGIIATSIPSLSGLIPFFDDPPPSTIKKISLPQTFSPTPNVLGTMAGRNLVRFYRRPDDIDLEKCDDREDTGGEGKERWRMSTQEYLLGMFPKTKPERQFERDRKEYDNESEMWG